MRRRVDRSRGEAAALGAVVDVGRLAVAIERGGAGFLSPAERAAWRAFPSAKRRREFAAGRLACKLAVRAAQRRSGRVPTPLHRLYIVRPGGKWPVCVAPGGRRWRLALSHDAELAVALCACGRYDLGVDVELMSARIVSDGDYFHPRECASPTPEHNVWRWCIKEAWAKLLGDGVQDYFRDIEAHPFDGRWHVGLPPAVAARVADAHMLCGRIGGSVLAVALARVKPGPGGRRTGLHAPRQCFS